MQKVLTVVVPSYNVEKYLQKTLESFVEESILSALEVLVVDDGSKDGTARIGKEFEKRYPGSFRVISKENGGHGSTINRGIEESCGKYFKVVDGDDWVNTEDFAKLIRNLENCSADYVVTDYCEVNDATGEETCREFSVLGEGKNREFSEAAARVQIPMHALTIRTAILKDHRIRLDEHCFYVDVEYILYPVPYVDTVRYYRLCVYMYRLALSTQSVSLAGYRKHIQNHMDVILNLAAFAEKYRNHPGAEREKTAYIGKRIAQMVGDQVTIFMSYPPKDGESKERFLRFDRELRKTSAWIYELSGRESGILRALRRLDFKGYRWIMRLARRRHGMR